MTRPRILRILIVMLSILSLSSQVFAGDERVNATGKRSITGVWLRIGMASEGMVSKAEEIFGLDIEAAIRPAIIVGSASSQIELELPLVLTTLLSGGGRNSRRMYAQIIPTLRFTFATGTPRATSLSVGYGGGFAGHLSSEDADKNYMVTSFRAGAEIMVSEALGLCAFYTSTTGKTSRTFNWGPNYGSHAYDVSQSSKQITAGLVYHP